MLESPCRLPPLILMAMVVLAVRFHLIAHSDACLKLALVVVVYTARMQNQM